MSDPKDYGREPGSDPALQDKLREDLKLALRRKDTVLRDAIRQIMSEFPRLTVPITLESGKKTTRPKSREEITDDDVIGIIQGLIKSEKSILELKQEQTSRYLEILESYLPRPATPEEIRAWIEANIDFSKTGTAMQAMKPIMRHFGRTADGGQIRKILEEIAATHG